MYTFEGLSWRTPLVIGCVGLHCVLSLGADAMMMAFSEADIEADVGLAMVLLACGLASIGMFVAAIIAVCVWTHRAMANAHALGGDEHTPTISPGYAVGSYFIPFINLYQPFKAMQEIHAVSTGAISSSAVTAWWAMWVIGNVLGNLSFRLDSDELALVSALVSTGAGIMLGMLVTEIDREQLARDAEQRAARAPNVSTYRAPLGTGVAG